MKVMKPWPIFKFGFSLFCDLFPPEDYSDSIVVLPSLDEATLAGIKNKKVLIIVENIPPRNGVHTVCCKLFDLQVICVLCASEKGDDHSKHKAVRYTRYERHTIYFGNKRGVMQLPRTT